MILTFPEWYTRAFDAFLQIFHALNRANKSIAPLLFEYNFVTACVGEPSSFPKLVDHPFCTLLVFHPVKYILNSRFRETQSHDFLQLRIADMRTHV